MALSTAVRWLVAMALLGGAALVLGLGAMLAWQGWSAGSANRGLLAFALFFIAVLPAATLVLTALVPLHLRLPKARLGRNSGRAIPKAGQ